METLKTPKPSGSFAAPHLFRNIGASIIRTGFRDIIYYNQEPGIPKIVQVIIQAPILFAKKVDEHRPVQRRRAGAKQAGPPGPFTA